LPNSQQIDFRSLGIFPSRVEILVPKEPNLRSNVVKGAYASVEDYLDVQFKLLREDYIEPLRTGIGLITGSINPQKNRQEVTKYA